MKPKIQLLSIVAGMVLLHSSFAFGRPPQEDIRPDGKLLINLKTNLLHDVLALPDIGAEFLFKGRRSAGLNLTCGWWQNNSRHRYWGYSAGELYFRQWFGREARRKPFAGHHAGIYAEAFTYNFRLSGKGVIGGEPGGTPFERMHWGVGVSYGYSFSIAASLNLDLSLGVGYQRGKYYEFTVEDDCNLWQTTKMRNWFGPTSLEVSLVWILNNKAAPAK